MRLTKGAVKGESDYVQASDVTPSGGLTTDRTSAFWSLPRGANQCGQALYSKRNGWVCPRCRSTRKRPQRRQSLVQANPG